MVANTCQSEGKSELCLLGSASDPKLPASQSVKASNVEREIPHLRGARRESTSEVVHTGNHPDVVSG